MIKKEAKTQQRLALHILRVLLLISVAGLSHAADRSASSSIKQLTRYSGPFRNDIGYQFFKIGETLGTEVLNVTTTTDKCLQDIAHISQGLDSYNEWAIMFPDSWGGLPFGLMWGHSLSFGQYEECVAASWQLAANDKLRGKYCLARVPIKKYMDKIVPRDIAAEKARSSYQYKRPEIFELGICIPSSCSAEMGNSILQAVLKSDVGVDTDAEMVVEKYCDYDHPIKLRVIDIFAICFFSFIVFVMFGSSVYDYNKTKNKEPKKPLFVAFSVLTNAPKIFNVKKVNNPNVIHCLHGLRSLSMFWVIFLHGNTIYYHLPHINRDKLYTWFESPYSMLVQNGTFCVDTFFFMSGMLVLWSVFREMDQSKGKLDLKMMYFHRYIRLTPVLAVVILYIMSLYKYSGAGPMWMKTSIQDQICAKNWWATLIYVQNYACPSEICVDQSWYLAADMQLYVLSPLFLIPLWKWGKKALPPIIIFGLLCMGCTFATFLNRGFTLFRVQDGHIDDRLRLTYYPTHTRVPTWLIGVIFGYFLYTKNRGRQIPLAKKWVITGWILALVVIMADIWGSYWRILPQNHNASLIEAALFQSLSRTSWALAIAWIVWACYNGHGGLINDFLSWSFFAYFSRLSYSMYAIHRTVEYVNGSRIQTDTHFGDYDTMLRWWHDSGISLILSIFVTLAFEIPILGIEKAMCKGPLKVKKFELTSDSVPVATIPYNNEPINN